MDREELIQGYLHDGKVMQVATISSGKPWICTVYYVADKKQNLYWLSLPTRRHSKDIMNDRHAAIAVAVKLDQPVIGLQAEGTVEVVTHAGTVQGIMENYISKYDTGHEFYDRFITGTAKHRMYKFRPDRIVLFDEVNFPDAPQEIDFN